MADWLPKPVFIWREWRTAARQGLPTLILSISGSLSNERVKESGIALLQGLPCAQPAPFPEGSGTLLELLQNLVAWPLPDMGVPPGQTLGSETACGRAERRVWGLASPTASRGAVPMHLTHHSFQIHLAYSLSGPSQIAAFCFC